MTAEQDKVRKIHW